VKSEPGYRTRTLAEERGCRVERCGHGLIHLTIGGLTLRLEARQFETIARTIALARRADAEGEDTRLTEAC
jgi:hypothetical protein